MPSFVEQNLTLYYEVDANVWQAEADLDKTKVFVEAVTVLDGAVPAAGLPETAFEEDQPPSLEDCVAIEVLRGAEPTAFSNVSYQLDQQNRLFVAVSGINYANQIQRWGLEQDGLLYVYCYPYDAGPAAGTSAAGSAASGEEAEEAQSVPMYYTIRKG